MVPPSFAGLWRSRRAWTVAWLVLLVIVAAYHGWRGRTAAVVASPPARQGIPVEVARVQATPLPIRLHALGTVKPVAEVVLRAQVDGELQRLHFQEGQTVQAGQLLAEIDPRPYQHALRAAEGRLAQTQAKLDNAEADLRRLEALARKDSVAGQALDTARATVAHYRGARQSDAAGVDDAQRQLEQTRIVAPMPGRIGLRRIDAGNQLRAADTAGLATLLQMAPISVLFSLPQERLAALRAAQAAGTPLRVEIWDADERRQLAEGALQALDNRIGLESGSVSLRAVFDNGDGALFPYQFVNVRLALPAADRAPTMPAAAVQYGADGPYAYVIDETLKARRRNIVLGPISAARVSVIGGLAVGEEVVVEGVDRLDEGRAVQRLAVQE